PSEKAILSARVIDRSIRPLFPKDLRNDVQVVATTLSTAQRSNPDIVALNGASAALTISTIPFKRPIAAVRVGRVNGEFVVNPTYEQAESGTLDFVVVASRDKVVMMEAVANEESESVVMDAIQFARPHINQILDMIEELRAKAGHAKIQVAASHASDAARGEVEQISAKAVSDALAAKEKLPVDEIFRTAEKDIAKLMKDKFPEENLVLARSLFEELKKNGIRKYILDKGVRPDGRAVDDIRDIQVRVGVIPRVHGSGLFKRGMTQVLTIATLGAPGDEQIIEDLSTDEFKRYLHQYNFPGYSTGEVKPMRSPGRRDIGHGALAERSLLPMIPSKEKFPYTIRLVSEILSSNGSTSMGSVCGSSLALMDAGVPITRPVAGVAMGLVTEGDRWVVLTDIQGLEDAVGDMDFKVAGTEKGITGIQVDIKIDGLSDAIIDETFRKARIGRLSILEKMKEVLPAPREEVSPNAPRIFIITINKDKIGGVIGTGGKNIRKITEDTGAQIDIEDDGRVFITAMNKESADEAIKMIRSSITEVEEGKIYRGRVKRILSIGAQIEILPRTVGLLKPFEIPDAQGKDLNRLFHIGDEVTVKVLKYDEDSNRVDLTMKGIEQGPPRRDHRDGHRGS
ncbi:MAG: polyribonucleotide nucleotidyltransferase, partial [bacterium]